MCTINGVLMHIMLFCCKICSFCDLRCFVAKSVLSRFTRFCVEKNLAKNCACGEKRTNIKYAYQAPTQIIAKGVLFELCSPLFVLSHHNLLPQALTPTSEGNFGRKFILQTPRS